MGRIKTVQIPQGEVLIEIKDLCKTYVMGDEIIHANDHLNLTIRMGEFVAIVGKSGSGKSTLMNIIGALDVPTSGTYLLGGEDVGDMTQNELADIRNRMIGFIFQQYNLLPKLNILENVELPLLYAHVSGEERKERALKQLERVGLKDKAKNMPNQLSGGEQQRVCIARALINHPALLLADEPTGNLDEKNEYLVMDIFEKLHNAGSSIIVVTHDPEVGDEAERMIVLEHGRIAREEKKKRQRPVIAE